MKKVYTLLIGLSLLFSSIPTASASPPTLWFGHHTWTGDYLTNGKIEVTQNGWGSYTAEELMKDNSVALDLLKKHSQYMRYAHISVFAGVLPSEIVAVLGLAYRNIPVALVGCGALLGTGMLAGYYESVSRHYLFEAVNVYNGVVKPSAMELHNTWTDQHMKQMSAFAPRATEVGFRFGF